MVAFNITTCFCCILKRNSWTMVSSRRDVVYLLKGLPGETVSFIFSIIPLAILPVVWLSWTACCCRGALGAMIASRFNRAKVAPSVAAVVEPEEEKKPSGPSKWTTAKNFRHKVQTTGALASVMRSKHAEDRRKKLAADLSKQKLAKLREEQAAEEARLAAERHAAVGRGGAAAR